MKQIRVAWVVETNFAWELSGVQLRNGTTVSYLHTVSGTHNPPTTANGNRRGAGVCSGELPDLTPTTLCQTVISPCTQLFFFCGVQFMWR